MDWKEHGYRVGASSATFDDAPKAGDDLDQFVALHRRKIEPWLSAVFQAEHLNLLLGSGFTSAVAFAAGVKATGMEISVGKSDHAQAILTTRRPAQNRWGGARQTLRTSCAVR